MKRASTFFAVLAICLVLLFDVSAQRKTAKAKFGKICGNPQIKCRTRSVTFQAHEIPFEIPRGNQVIVESEPFYAIILKSVKLKGDINCENAVSERKRLEIQILFPSNKVFALKCADAGDLYYTNIANDVSFIAVYAGKTLTVANKFLKTVRANAKYKSGNVRKMQAEINGT